MTTNNTKQFYPLFLMLACTFFYSVQNLLVKLLSSQYSFWLIIFVRGLVGSTLSLIALRGNICPKTTFKNLLYRSVLGATTISLTFLSLSQTRIFYTSLITSTAPLVTAIIGRKLASWHAVDTLSVIVCSAGLICMFYNTKANSGVLLGTTVAAVSALSQGVVNVLIKSVDETTYIVTLYAMFCSVVTSTPGVVYKLVKVGIPAISVETLLSLVAVGVTSYTAQVLKTKSIQLTSSWSILTTRYLEVVIALLLDVFFLNHQVKMSDVIGGFLVVIGCLVSILTNHYYTENTIKQSTEVLAEIHVVSTRG